LLAAPVKFLTHAKKREAGRRQKNEATQRENKRNTV